MGVTKSMKNTRASPAFFHLPLLNGQTISSLGTPDSVRVSSGDSSSDMMTHPSFCVLMTILLWSGFSTIVFNVGVLISIGGR